MANETVRHQRRISEKGIKAERFIAIYADQRAFMLRDVHHMKDVFNPDLNYEACT